MGMTLTQFQDEIRENVKRQVAVLPASRLTLWTNWAQGYLADLHTYEEMRVKDSTISTAASTSTIACPTRMKDLYSAMVVDGARSRKLTYVRAKEFDIVVPLPTTYATGLPEWYVDYSTTFELFPIPDAIYNVPMRISRYPIDLSAGSDQSALLRKDALIVAIATTFGFYSLREVEDAAYWGTEVVGSLYSASLLTDRSDEDWSPIARGFGGNGSMGTTVLSGNWWTNPFVGRRL